MKTSRFLVPAILLAGGLALASCSTVEPQGVPLRPLEVPPWTRDGKHPDFPNESHLAAYAASDAALNARNEADARLEFLITERALQVAGERLDSTRLKQLLTGSAAWIQVSEFGQGIKRDISTDGFEAVAVSAISLGELKYRSLGLLKVAREQWQQNVAPAEVDNALLRTTAWSERFLLAARVMALALLAEGELDREAWQGAESAAMMLVDIHAQLKITQGGVRQRAQLLGGTREDLSITAEFRGKAPQGLRLAWSVEAPANGVLSGFSEFNRSGQAFCKVFMLAGGGGDFAYVQARLDLESLTGRKLGISMPAWRWQISVPSRRQALLGLEITETFGEVATESVFGPAATEWARLNGLALEADTHSIKARDYLYRLRISGNIKVTVTRRGEALLARAEGQIALKDVDTGATIYRYSPSALLEGDKDSKPAELAAFTLREAAAETLLEFGSRVLALLPAPASE